MPTEQQVRNQIGPDGGDLFNNLKQALRTGQIPRDREFDVEQTVILPVTDSDQGLGKWRGITVEMVCFGIGAPEPPQDEPDDPFWIMVGTTPEGPKTARYPSGPDPEAQPVPTGVRINAMTPVAHHGALDGPNDIRVWAQATAYEEDISSIWRRFLQALGSDLYTAGQLGLAQVPGLAAFAGPSAALTGASQLVGSAFERQRVGGDISALDSLAIQWYRTAKSPRTWIARKWTLHTNPTMIGGDPATAVAWYLAEWHITLSIEARSYSVAMATVASGLQFAMLGDHVLDAGALRVARGESVFSVAEALGKPAHELAYAVNELTNGDTEARQARLQSALLGEIELLKKG